MSNDRLAQALRNMIDWLDDGNRMLSDSCAADVAAARAALAEHEAAQKAEPMCRADGRCQYAIDHGAEGLGHCPKGKCAMPAEPAPELTDEQLNAVVSSINRELTGFRGWSLLQVMRAAIAADRKNRKNRGEA